jgi:hypothetical protein
MVHTLQSYFINILLSFFQYQTKVNKLCFLQTYTIETIALALFLARSSLIVWYLTSDTFLHLNSYQVLGDWNFWLISSSWMSHQRFLLPFGLSYPPHYTLNFVITLNSWFVYPVLWLWTLDLVVINILICLYFHLLLKSSYFSSFHIHLSALHLSCEDKDSSSCQWCFISRLCLRMTLCSKGDFLLFFFSWLNLCSCALVNGMWTKRIKLSRWE